MLSNSTILLTAFLYLAIVFAIAYFGDRKPGKRGGLINNPVVYSLSLAIYCTAWTYYGSVGRAATTGLGFLPIYLGPTLMAGLWWFVLRKMVRIAKKQHVTSIADFIGSRYGKSAFLASLVTLICVIGILPYISLQLKAIATSYAVIQSDPTVAMSPFSHTPFWNDTTFYVAILLALFSILFGTRQLDSTEQHKGMVAAIAFESIVKLVAFLAVGIYTCFFLFDGPGDIFTQAIAKPELAKLLTMEAQPGAYINWLSLIIISMFAVFLLPRQFQVAVVENTDESHIDAASWMFPLYLLAINLFVLPLALGGLLLFPEGGVDPDTFVLTIPMSAQQPLLTLLVFIGGLSAATGMVIVATIALSTMVSNELIMPLFLRFRNLDARKNKNLSNTILLIRRCAIIAIIMLAYLYFKLISESYALVTIGLVSFVAAAQFAPAILLGIYWRGANRLGAIVAIVSGFGIWVYTLFLPAISQSGWLDSGFIDQGPWGIELLKPYALMGLDGLDPISHAVVWSLPVNVLLLIIVSTFTPRRAVEKIQAIEFVDVFENINRNLSEAQVWSGDVSFIELKSVVAQFVGNQVASDGFRNFANNHGLEYESLNTSETSLYLVNHAEQMLSGVVGTSSARSIISELYDGEQISIDDVLEILTQTSHVLEHSRQLEQKTLELEKTSAELRDANTQLQALDKMKDEFVSTVSHELRTPLTSIRSFSEILFNTPDISLAESQKFLQIIVKESERLTRLINDVLDIAKLEAGSIQLNIEEADLRNVLASSIDSVSRLFQDRDMKLEYIPPSTPLIYPIDQDRLQQVMINILSNAAKFCTLGEGHVWVSLSQQERCIIISINDNGPGIKPEHQKRIFTRFEQVQDHQSGKPKGSGLGLAISKLIIEQHGGNLDVESDGVHGSTFIVSLPLH